MKQRDDDSTINTNDRKVGVINDELHAAPHRLDIICVHSFRDQELKKVLFLPICTERQQNTRILLSSSFDSPSRPTHAPLDGDVSIDTFPTLGGRQTGRQTNSFSSNCPTSGTPWEVSLPPPCLRVAPGGPCGYGHTDRCWPGPAGSTWRHGTRSFWSCGGPTGA